MNTRTLGKKGFSVSEIGLGTWQIGGNWGKDLSKEKAFEILQTAVENGISFFDTADVYGDGKSEQFIGDFLKQIDTKIRVATKFGRGGDVYPNNYSKDALRSSIESSLQRLNVDALDLLQLHCIPTIELQKGNIFDWLRELKQEGLIKNFGASVETIEQGLICLEQENLLSLQVIFNIFRQKLITELLPQAKAKGVGLIIRLPLASGLLTGKFEKETIFDEQDHRNFNKDGEAFSVGETFAGLPFEKGVELSDILKTYLPEKMTMAQMSLRWILDHEAVSTIIPGASSPKQVIANAAVTNLAPLSKELHDKLSIFYAENVQQFIRGVY